MASRVSRTRRQAAPDSGNVDIPRIELEYVDIHSIQPYPFNPRKNAAAVDALVNSMRSFGFPIPVVLDANNVLVAGHTRIEAAKKLGLDEVPAIRVAYLSDEQVNAFRVIDNKVAELADWDFDLLAGEIGKLKESGIDFTDFGWTRESLDCLHEIVSADCLSTDGLVSQEDRERTTRAERRAPATARIVIGELTFFMPATEYRNWITGLREAFDFNEAAIIEEVKIRLGMPH